MYKKFFGLKENPFKLVPNPSYLFLSKSHEEALAHLNYAVSNEDGFAKITGEVGTGKTTLCRAFLEYLDEKTEAAYIFNPKLTSLQLLKTVNQEFGILSEADNSKDLIDILNTFLMAKKARGKKVILLIDEAQNLSKGVLEQLRLLSNLETNQSKLLQIILVGQPELDLLLNSPGLRQLKQRISVSCRLLPLTMRETGAYIRHRISVASRKPAIHFPGGAVRKIYKFSNGIPRLVNIACDRALLTAFSLGQNRLTGSIAHSAIRDLVSKDKNRQHKLFSGSTGILTMAFLSLVFVLAWMNPPVMFDYFIPNREHESTPVVVRLPVPDDLTPIDSPLASTPEESPRASTPVESAPVSTIVESVPVSTPPQSEKKSAATVWESEAFGQALRSMNQKGSRQAAIVSALRLWNPEIALQSDLENVKDNQTFFQLAAKRNGMLVQRVSGDLGLLQRLNLPAVLEFSPSESKTPVYLTVYNVGDEKMSLFGNPEGEAIALKTDDVAEYWTGIAYVPWKDFYGCTGEIPTFAPEASVKALKLLLKDIGYQDLEINPIYDDSTKQAVVDIQKKNGLPPDGVVGPFTKIVLYNEQKDIKIPHIRGAGEVNP
ncbi:MAG TPA: AAA family ATPase [Deltaproteobacteria bacterium]|nr:AAA family ATPase [Deltaproteobacteria bacterium]